MVATHPALPADAARRATLLFWEAYFPNFIELLREWHRLIVKGRPDKRTGEFTLYPSRAGDTVFVAPDHLDGTLRRGYEILESLTTPTQSGTLAAFRVAEVHPFDDGNG